MERAERLEPQVSPRQSWPPAVTRAGWPGEGTSTPALLWKSRLPGKWMP